MAFKDVSLDPTIPTTISAPLLLKLNCNIPLSLNTTTHDIEVVSQYTRQYCLPGCPGRGLRYSYSGGDSHSKRARHRQLAEAALVLES